MKRARLQLRPITVEMRAPIECCLFNTASQIHGDDNSVKLESEQEFEEEENPPI